MLTGKALVIARCRVQYKKNLLFRDLFYEPLGEWNNSQIWETSKIFANIARGSCAITSLLLAPKLIEQYYPLPWPCVTMFPIFAKKYTFSK